MLAGLSEYSISFAEPLFKAFPWLEQHAKVHPNSGAEQGSLLVEYSPEPVREHCELWVTTDGGEVTVGFGMTHMHFDWPKYPEAEHWEDPLDFLADLFEDRVLIEDWTKDGKWSGSSTLDRGAEPDVLDMDEDNVIYVRSWSGALDRVIRRP